MKNCQTAWLLLEESSMRNAIAAHLTLVFTNLLLTSISFAHDESFSFVPQNCTVENWCLVKATDCFLGHFTHPQGLWQGHAQYSVVRRAIALCPTGYYGGTFERRTLLGPVEPVLFASDVLTTEEKAKAGATELCAAYRQDWVAAAPACTQD